MSRVSLSNVNKIYRDGSHVVKDLNLEIAERQFVVLVGPSGCGKSTTLRMIAGLEDISSGTLRIGDRVVNDMPPKERNIAMVFQNYALYPHKTVFENMGFALKLRGMPPAQITTAVNRVARLLSIEPLLKRKPAVLSGGQRQRVALGRAIVREPSCFLFDEPLSNLDAKLRVHMRAEIKRIHLELGSTTIYVTHDQEEEMTLGDRVAVMKDGIVQQEGSALDIYDRPINRFVAEFLGSPPMNFLDGELQQKQGKLCFIGPACSVEIPQEMGAKLGEQHTRSVTLGLRPENLGLLPVDSKEQGQHVEACVTLIQPLGDRTTLHATIGSEPLTAQLPDSASSRSVDGTGATVKLHFDPERLHLFEHTDLGARLN